jgi:hypothetical protein
MTADQPSLFDAVAEATTDDWTRAGWVEAVVVDGDAPPDALRAAPKRARRSTPPALPDDGVDWAARGAAYREKWAASTAAARAKIEEDR